MGTEKIIEASLELREELEFLLCRWRFSNSPYHFKFILYCLSQAEGNGEDEMIFGSLKTSVSKMSEATSISRSKIKTMLKDLSTGDNPELLINTSTNQQYGYTKITVLKFHEII